MNGLIAASIAGGGYGTGRRWGPLPIDRMEGDGVVYVVRFIMFQDIIVDQL